MDNSLGQTFKLLTFSCPSPVNTQQPLLLLLWDIAHGRLHNNSGSKASSFPLIFHLFLPATSSLFISFLVIQLHPILSSLQKSLSLVTGLPLSLFSSNLTLLLGPLGWQQFSKSQAAFIHPRVFLVCSLMSTGFSDQSVKVSMLLYPPSKPYLNPGLIDKHIELLCNCYVSTYIDLIVGTLLLKKEKHTMVT